MTEIQPEEPILKQTVEKFTISYTTITNAFTTSFLASWIVLLSHIYLQQFLIYILQSYISFSELRPMYFNPMSNGLKKYLIVEIVLASGMIASILMVVMSTKLFDYYYKIKGREKQLILWIKIYAWVSIFGTLMSSVFTRQGFAYFLYYMRIKTPIHVAMFLIGLVLLYIISTNLFQSFIRIAHSRNYFSQANTLFKYKLISIWLPIIVVFYVNLKFIFNHTMVYYQLISYPIFIFLLNSFITPINLNVRIAKETTVEKLNVLFLILFTCGFVILTLLRKHM